MSFDIQNKTALVTGADRGIGKAIVESLIQHRARKVYAAVQELDTVQPLIDKYGDKVIPVAIELLEPDTVSSAAKIADDVELLINNAGVLSRTPMMAANTLDRLQFEIGVNVYGLIHMAHAFAPILKKNGGGALVQLNSVASVSYGSDLGTYSVSKATSYAVTQGLREELKKQGTQVLSVHPGPIKTDMGDTAGFGDEVESPAMVSEAIINALETGEFHVFPGVLAQNVWQEYESFAVNIVEAN